SCNRGQLMKPAMCSPPRRSCARCGAKTRSITTMVFKLGGYARTGRPKMSKFLKLTAALAVLATPAFADGYGLGRPALPEEVAAWDIDVRPDGVGLPAGSGDVLTGEDLFADQCAACHGDFAEGVGNWPKLAGGADTLARADPLKTVG